MKRRMVSVLLAAAMAASLFAGCGQTGSSEKTSDNTAENSASEASGSSADESSAEEAKGDPELIKIYVPTSGSVDDLEAVMEEVNKITVEKINVEVEFHPYEFGQWFQQYSLFLSGTEDIDILANYGGYSNAVAQGACYDITDLLQEYGQDIIAQEGDYIKSGQVNGVQYAVPIYASYAWTMGILYRKDVVAELGLEDQVAAVDSLDDWGEILAAVKEAKPEMTPFVTNGGSTVNNFNYGTWDSLSNNYGVLMNGGATSEVVDLFETDEYAQLCSIMHDWYEAGYTSKDIQTQTDGYPTLVQNDAAFSTIGQADFNTEYYQTTTTGKEIGAILLSDPVARTYNNVTYSVMSNSEHAEAAVKFMNLWFSDKELGTLISYGIEGTNYVLDENGMGTYSDGQSSQDCGYHMGSAISNINRISWNTENPDYAELLVESNDSAQKSAGLGFAFDPENVTNEITQLDNVCSKYQIGLECGALDPETYLPEFIQALKDAGIDTVIAEKQSQLDAWNAQ